MSIPVELPKPVNDDDFERMCIDIYSVVFGDPLPAKNGSRGQGQDGIDGFIYTVKDGRIGIQCKRYNKKRLTSDHILAEVKNADSAAINIQQLIFATTAQADAPLRKFVNDLADQRRKANQFTVSIDFWDEICEHIRKHPRLQERYEPSAPGAALHRLETAHANEALLSEERHNRILAEMRKIYDLMQGTNAEKAVTASATEELRTTDSATSTPVEETHVYPVKIVTPRTNLMYLTLDQLAISWLEGKSSKIFERRVTIKTAEGELFVDALRQDDTQEADDIVEVRWIRKRYLDAPIWARQVDSKIHLYNLLTGRQAIGTLVLVVPEKLGALDELPIIRDSLSTVKCDLKVAIARYSDIGFDPGPITAGVFASNTSWPSTS